MHDHRYITTREASAMLRLRRPETVAHYLRSGLLRGTKVGRQWLIEARSLTRFMATSAGNG